jgi:CPA2 family monovalent cation:H+ antiporter-2
LVAFTFPDAAAAALALHHVREINPEVCVLARARFATDQQRLEGMGVSVVIHDEQEAANAVVTQAVRLLAEQQRGIDPR